MNTRQSIGHIAIPVWSIEDTRYFYGEILGCPEGRLSDKRVDFDFFGQHLVAHVASNRLKSESAIEKTFEEHLSRHIGVIIDMTEWRRIARRLEGKKLNHIVPPEIKNEGTDNEEGFIFMMDPANNTVEFKGFDNPSKLSPILPSQVPSRV
jgi:extradiol dioxygenase family protein